MGCWVMSLACVWVAGRALITRSGVFDKGFVMGRVCDLFPNSLALDELLLVDECIHKR